MTTYQCNTAYMMYTHCGFNLDILAEENLYFYKLAKENKLKVNKKCALALYTGIVTDSNRFLYEGVNSETFEIARYLLSRNINIFEIKIFK